MKASKKLFKMLSDLVKKKSFNGKLIENNSVEFNKLHFKKWKLRDITKAK